MNLQDGAAWANILAVVLMLAIPLTTLLLNKLRTSQSPDDAKPQGSRLYRLLVRLLPARLQEFRDDFIQDLEESKCDTSPSKIVEHRENWDLVIRIVELRIFEFRHSHTKSRRIHRG